MLTLHPPGDPGAPMTTECLQAGLWIDLLDPTADEIALVQAAVGVELPTRSEMQEIEVSSRLYTENDALFMTATVIHKADAAFPEVTPITFVLTPANLVTIRYGNPTPFRTFSAKCDRPSATFSTRDKMFGGLMDEIIDRVADILELAGAELDAISRIIFNIPNHHASTQLPTGQKPDYTAILERIGRCGDLAGKARESLLSLARVVAFYIEIARVKAPHELDEHWRTVRSDVSSLTEHANFVSNKVNFFLDATLGMINIEQNTIIKIFSIAAVVFLPPTMIASIYGMNFNAMPEIDWRFGYPWALALMIISAILPCWYFRRKGWL
ncbi:MAG: magnesium transporter CorA family protein [Verrucomicrobiales bacterium]